LKALQEFKARKASQEHPQLYQLALSQLAARDHLHQLQIRAHPRLRCLILASLRASKAQQVKLEQRDLLQRLLLERSAREPQEALQALQMQGHPHLPFLISASLAGIRAIKEMPA
jgi:hypothetical protein